MKLGSLTLRKEHMLSAFVNRVLWKMFGHKREEVTGGWKELCKMEHHQLNLSLVIIR